MSSTYFKISYEDCLDIASAIREKGGVIEDPIKGSLFASAIRDLVTAERDRQDVVDYFTGVGVRYTNSATGSYTVTTLDNINCLDLPNATSVRFSSGCSMRVPCALSLAEATYMYADFGERSYLKSIYAPKMATLNGGIFYNAQIIEEIDLPACTSCSGSMWSCYNLTKINMPLLNSWITVSRAYALRSAYLNSLSEGMTFAYCDNLETVYVPNYTGGRMSFWYCPNLMTLALGASFLNSQYFYSCSRLLSLFLTSTSRCSVSIPLSSIFVHTPLTETSYTGGKYMDIYVPSSLYSSYVNASYWSDYASRIKSISTSDMSFTINGVKYYGAVYNWTTWLGTSQNTSHYRKVYNNVMDSSLSNIVAYDGTPVLPWEIISAGFNYELLSLS